MPWPSFTRKNRNRRNLEKKINKNLRNMAASRGYWATKQEFGRAQQVRVANVFGAPGVRHDPAARFQKKEAEKYLAEMRDAVASIPPGMVDQMREFGDSLRQQIAGAVASGAPTIQINISLSVARALEIAIALFMIAAALTFGTFFSILITAVTGTPTFIAADMLITAWGYITGRRPENAEVPAQGRATPDLNNGVVMSRNPMFER